MSNPEIADLHHDPDVALHRAYWERALGWDDYLATGNDTQRQRWSARRAEIALPPELRARLAGVTRSMHLLVLSGIWCGDCVREGALMTRLAEATPAIALRFIDRDGAPELRDRLRVLGAMRVPATLVLSEDFEFVDRLGDRTLATYRRMAASALGPACPTGIGPPPADEVAAALGEYVDRLERAQLLLRLAPRLRERHGD